jgi:hypothetical protein
MALRAGAAAALAGCSLPVENTNAPDRHRLYSDPATIEAALTGAVRSWINTRQDGTMGLVLPTMADSYTGGWNDWCMRFYSGEPRIAWDNGTGNCSNDDAWYGFYSAMSTANDILQAIRKNGVSLDEGSSHTLTRRAETASVLLQGVALAMIALNYDSGFVATEATASEDYLKLPVLSAARLRDTALARFEEAIRLAEANPFSTPPTWLSASGGPTYTSAQLVRLIRTMGAEAVALLPRNGAENAAVDWLKVVSWASRGLSAAPAFDFEFVSDWSQAGLFDANKSWGNDLTTFRVDTRLSRMLSPNQVHPWPAPNGNPPPVSADRRMGDGTWGPEDNFLDLGGLAATANSGTDFAWTRKGKLFPAGRGTYHNSNIFRHRYDCTTWIPNVPGGRCQVPLYTAAFNDLLWAEGLIRSNSNRAAAAQLINKTRVGRGGLPALTGAEPLDQVLGALQYEQEIEMMDFGGTVFYNRRRIDGLQPFTPRQMPIPFKELDLLRRELYTYGGPNHPDGSAQAEAGTGSLPNVRDIYRGIEARRWREAPRRPF